MATVASVHARQRNCCGVLKFLPVLRRGRAADGGYPGRFRSALTLKLFHGERRARPAKRCQA
jgi:hypothetical protein